MEKTKPNTTKARIHQSKEINVLQHKINPKKLEPDFVAFYDTREKLSKETLKKKG